MTITNEKTKDYAFLKEMYDDPYFPDKVIDKGKQILINLCVSIETQKPPSLAELYKLTHAATDKFNDLQDDLEAHDSEIETIGREIIAENFEYIAHAYGFKNADIEELIATRDW